MQDAELGETIAGYVLESNLGEGSTSRVFVGRHAELGHRAAIKVLTFSVMESSDARIRLKQEAQAVADIQHPHIVEVLDFHESARPPRIALVMELIDGPSMRSLRGAPLAPPAARELSAQLVSAVSAAHAAGVIHRDLKPDNILFTEDPRASGARLHLKVVDFGLAKRMGPGDLLQTAAGTMLGTPAYMAPEQIMGRSPPSTATDVYAVAELVYELFVGERVFPQESTQSVLQIKMRGEIPELPMPEPLNHELRPLLLECLAADPNLRPRLSVLAQRLEGLGARAMSIPAGKTAIATTPPLPRAIPDAGTVVDDWSPAPITRRLAEADVATGKVAEAEVDAALHRARLLRERKSSTGTGETPVVMHSPAVDPAERDDWASTELMGVPVPEADTDPHDSPDFGAPQEGEMSVLRPLDLERTPARSGAGIRIPVDEAADGEAETVPPEPGVAGPPVWILGLVAVAVLGMALWVLVSASG